MTPEAELNDEGRTVYKPSGPRAVLVRWLSVALSLFILYTSAFGQFDSLIQRPVFTALVVIITLLFYPFGEQRSWRPFGMAVDIALAAVTAAACIYVVYNHDTIMVDLPNARWYDIVLAAGLVLAVIETARRAVGLVFPTIVVCGLIYAFLGQYLSGPLSHRAFDTDFITETLLLGDLGVWGLLTGVAATTIAAFVLFGSVLLFTGAGQTFMDLGRIVGWTKPGRRRQDRYHRVRPVRHHQWQRRRQRGDRRQLYHSADATAEISVQVRCRRRSRRLDRRSNRAAGDGRRRFRHG